MHSDLLTSWREARRYAVPPAMVMEATARRAAGDVAGACAAARVDLLVDVARVRRDHGAEVAGRLADDLRHLAPDLLRWHAPRVADGGRGLISRRRRLTLAVYGDRALQAYTPRLADGPQRLALRFVRFDPRHARTQHDRWDDSRYLWDARHAGELRERVGGRDRLPFHAPDGRLLDAGELPAARPDDPVALVEWTSAVLDRDAWTGAVAEAWTAAGIAVELPENWRFRVARAPVPVTVLRAALDRDLPKRFGGTLPDGPVGLLHLDSDYPWSPHVTVAVHHAGGRFVVRSLDHGARDRDPRLPIEEELRAQGVPDLPLAWHRRSPDLELLRRGLLTPQELHPLVREALFPGADVPYRPVTRPTPPVTRVRCRADWHRVDWRDGRLTPLAHTPAEAARERSMLALGGEVPGCFTVERRWRTGGPGKLPKNLRSWRRHTRSTLLHGDDREFARLLDVGVDPAGIERDEGRNTLHLLAHLDRPDLVGRLVDAGLDLHARDHGGRTPLASALRHGGSAALTRALLDAGASATTVDHAGATLLHQLHSTDAATILPWLLDAGLDLEALDHVGRTPLLALLFEDAPAEAIRALADAGADVHRTTDRERYSVPFLIEQRHRTDLDLPL